ncbi:MAG: histidinol-phosphatase [Bacteroidetes bacterium]|nr:histidinol-phosphatase [Bacteroidota bacterium]
MQLFNFHTHTHYCDGSAEPEAYVKQAIQLGFSTLGFSGHAPIPFKNEFAIKEVELQNYCESIRSLKTKYADKIKIYLALEIDYIPGFTKDFSAFNTECKLDYTIGSVHLVVNPENNIRWFIDGGNTDTYDNGLQLAFHNDIRTAVKAYYHQINSMILTQKPDIIGHFDKIKMNNKNRFFTQNEKWYMDLVMESLDIIKSQQSIVEVNTRGLYKKRSDELFPSLPILMEMQRLNIPITISADAHKPEELDLLFQETAGQLKEIGYANVMVFDGKAWNEVAIK